MTSINIDFETYSEVDIKKAGAWAYSCHPSTKVICMAWCGKDTKVICNHNEDTIRVNLELNRSQKRIVKAWNSFFEYCIIKNTLGINYPIELFRDTAAQAAAMSLPWALGKCGEALGLPEDELKDKRGKYLIQKLCKPQRNGERCLDIELLDEFYDYCRQDVISEMAVARRLKPLTATEQKVWMLDQIINVRGVPVDVDSMTKARQIYDEEYDKQFAVLKGMTELDNPNSRNQFLGWLQERVPVDNTQAATLRGLLEAEETPDIVKDAIDIKLTLASAAPKKYFSMLQRQVDGRIHGVLKYHGASTGRWASTGVNFQNIARPTIKDTDLCIEEFSEVDNEWIGVLYGDTMGALSSCLRGMIKAPEGYKFVVSDYSAIEARVVAWLAGQTDVLDVFRSKQDVYKHAASGIYNVPIEEVDSDQRFVGKTAVLALGYQGGAKAFANMAKNYGVDIPEDKADGIKKAWRKANQNIVKYWYAIEECAVMSLVERGTVRNYRGISFKATGNFLYCKLPSGRRLAYYKPRLSEGAYDKLQVVYHTNTARGFQKQHTYGGKLVENITQAVARDIMAEAMLRVEEYGFPIVLSVHDELVTLCPDNDNFTEAGLSKIMCKLPEWATGLPVDAEGYESIRYRK